MGSKNKDLQPTIILGVMYIAFFYDYANNMVSGTC